MKKKKIKRRKLKFKNVGLFFLIIIISIITIFFVYTCFIDVKIKNIYISGNKYVSDIEIMRVANIEKYPKIMSMSESKIKNKIINNIKIIKDVKVKKRLNGKLILEILEYNPYFYNKNNNLIILDDGSEIEYNNMLNIPSLDKDSIKDEKLLKKLLKKYDEVDNDIKHRISEIRYDPNSVDDERFLLTMNDGNYVYITLVKIEEVNYYLKILPTLDNKKGVLNLDYGNNFEIVE